MEMCLFFDSNVPDWQGGAPTPAKATKDCLRSKRRTSPISAISWGPRAGPTPNIPITTGYSGSNAARDRISLLSAASAADIAAAVQMAVDEFNTWQCARLGRDINPSRLINLLMQTGIKRVDLRAPAFTVLRDGGDKTVPQVASFGTAAIVNGGYEDE